MRLRDIIGLILALVLAMGVALLTRVFLAKEEPSKKQTTAKETTSLKILVAGKSLFEGSMISPGDLQWQVWPEDAANSSYIREGAIKVDDLKGAVVLQNLNKGQPVVASNFVKPGEKGILAAVLSPGKRAISIEVTAPAVNSGLIFPGDNVDVIAAKLISNTSGDQTAQSRTIVRNIKVLALDFEMANTHEKPKAVPKVATLEVSPSQAELILASAKESPLSLSLYSISNEPTVVEESKPAVSGTVILMRGKERNQIQVQE
ncbi:MAG: Flp pilus assembly protein CpaB [Proteobacteria bacterium]|nr:Flp pilus assembly protein CpaB [Pseudomonadota bacterium]